MKIDMVVLKSKIDEIYEDEKHGEGWAAWSALCLWLAQYESAQQTVRRFVAQGEIMDKPDGKWKCRACGSIWDGSQLVLDSMSTAVKWTCGDYFCGGTCDRVRVEPLLALDGANCPSCQAESVIVGTQCLVCGVFSPRK